MARKRRKKRGISRKNWKPRHDPGYDEFVKRVLSRDKRTCQMPGCTSKLTLQVHHIIRYADAPGLRTEPDNGITLCGLCHYKIRGKEAYFQHLFMRINNAKKPKR